MARYSRALRGLATAVAAASIVLALGAAPAQADSWIPIAGSGSTWSQNALDQWRKNVAANYGMTVNYSGTGSSAGRQDFIKQTVDFAISEIPFQAQPEDGSPPERPDTGYAYMPIVAGGTSLMYNLKIGGKRVTNLRLSGDVVAKVFTGQITNWNDAAIQADNPGLAMPDKKITPVVRSDGSGTSAQFTKWMSSQYPSVWTRGMTSQFPMINADFKAQNGSLGVAGYVSQDYGEGAITYVEYSYALKSGFPVVKVLNAAGYYVEPTAQSVAVALLAAQIDTTPGDTYLTQILDGVYNNADARTYPMSSYSYMIVPTQVNKVFTTDKGKTLGAFATYMLCAGQQQASALGYSPLPMNLVLAGSDQIKRIPGADQNGIDVNSCNNPTFKAGDDPKNNQLAATAPQPAACDKKGPDQCTSGTAGAVEETPVTGSGSGGSAANAVGASSAGTSTAGSSAAGSADAASAAAYDANGNLVSGSAAGGAAAVSSPFSLPDGGWGASQTMMCVAAGILLLTMLAPPFVSRRLRRDNESNRTR